MGINRRNEMGYCMHILYFTVKRVPVVQKKSEFNAVFPVDQAMSLCRVKLSPTGPSRDVDLRTQANGNRRETASNELNIHNTYKSWHTSNLASPIFEV